MRSLAPALAVALLLFPACGNDAAPAPSKAGGAPAPASTPSATVPAAVPAGSPYLLSKEPSGAMSVIDVKAKGEAKEIVVVGRVNETVPGFAAFTLTDASLKYCGQETKDDKADDCTTPWDYCCIAPDKVAAATIAVGVRTKGEVVAVAVPELRNMDLVVVHGQLVKTADGTTRVEADGWFRKERPVVPANVVFPK